MRLIDADAEIVKLNALLAGGSCEDTRAGLQAAKLILMLAPTLETRDEQTGQSEQSARQKQTGPTGPDGALGALTAYITDNLHALTPGNWEQLREIMEDGMSAEMVRLAVDAANAQRVRSFAYMMSILEHWFTAGYRTPEEVREAERKRDDAKAKQASSAAYNATGAKPNPALAYEQRKYDNDDFQDDYYLRIGREIMKNEEGCERR